MRKGYYPTRSSVFCLRTQKLSSSHTDFIYKFLLAYGKSKDVKKDQVYVKVYNSCGQVIFPFFFVFVMPFLATVTASSFALHPCMFFCGPTGHGV